MEKKDNWIPVSEKLPENQLIVETKIDDGKGVRNKSLLKRSNAVWFFSDGSMYVYYTPTHWRLPSPPNQ